MRHQARNHLPVVNRWHHVVDLTAEDRRWVGGEAPSANESALIRSGLWRPDSWDGDSGSIAARGFAGEGLIAGASLAQTEAALEQSYTNELY